MTQNSEGSKRPWKGVVFHCCAAYGRVYLNPTTHKWVGNCPKCMRSRVVKV